MLCGINCLSATQWQSRRHDLGASESYLSATEMARSKTHLEHQMKPSARRDFPFENARVKGSRRQTLDGTVLQAGAGKDER